MSTGQKQRFFFDNSNQKWPGFAVNASQIELYNKSKNVNAIKI